jgi:hypothetical protein
MFTAGSVDEASSATMPAVLTGKLLRRAARRLFLIRISSRFRICLMVTAGLYGVLLVMARLLALIPDQFSAGSLLLPLATALVLAPVLTRRPTAEQTARLVDHQVQTADLFLTTVRIEQSLGAYRPVVVAQAEVVAPTVDCRQVAPFTWRRKALHVAMVMALLVTAVVLLPSLDPWGKAEARAQLQSLAQELEESRQLTRSRTEVLVRQEARAAVSPAVRRAMEQLLQTLGSLRTSQSESNDTRLRAQQEQIGQLWRKAGERQLAPRSGGRSFSRQQLGAGLSEQTWEWQRELARGSSNGIEEELSQLRKLSRQLAGESDPDRRRQLQEELQQRLQRLSRLLEEELRSQPTGEAMQRARQSLTMSGIEGLSAEALTGLQESLELVGVELEAAMQELRDLQALEEALQALQMARRLDQQGRLSSGPGESAQSRSLRDYSRLYQRLLADGTCQVCGRGDCPGAGGGLCSGGGTGGTGSGQGGRPPEDDSLRTGFQPEQSRSTMTAGAVLLQWQSRGVSAPGQALQTYQEAIRRVRQGASEAVLTEQVPPGYHEAIRRYFETIESTDDTKR